MEDFAKLTGSTVTAPLLAAARNAARICLGATASDRVVLMFDATTNAVAAGLLAAFKEIGVSSIEVFDMDSFAERPFAQLPAVVQKPLERATVSAWAARTLQGEFKTRRAMLEIVTKAGIRHAHMPSITPKVFEDGLSMDYRQVKAFVDRLVDVILEGGALTMTSAGGTNIDFRCSVPPKLDKLDGIITAKSWQNLPSGQIVITPEDAAGTYVCDRTIGDWFENKYDVREYPVTVEFEKGQVRALKCDNRRLEHDLWLFIRSSDNSGRICELVMGANLGLTQDHTGALFDMYRPGASVSIGALPLGDASWTAATFLPLIGHRTSLWVGARRIMTDDVFAPDLVAMP
ncbi:MAG: hypothetical protein PHU25_20315 [Deltaproteobacteria bacterium]|nr:hypothetical protein [Deltaproteobacteria bacterium]